MHTAKINPGNSGGPLLTNDGSYAESTASFSRKGGWWSRFVYSDFNCSIERRNRSARQRRRVEVTLVFGSNNCSVKSHSRYGTLRWREWYFMKSGRRIGRFPARRSSTWLPSGKLFADRSHPEKGAPPGGSRRRQGALSKFSAPATASSEYGEFAEAARIHTPRRKLFPNPPPLDSAAAQSQDSGLCPLKIKYLGTGTSPRVGTLHAASYSLFCDRRALSVLPDLWGKSDYIVTGLDHPGLTFPFVRSLVTCCTWFKWPGRTFCPRFATSKRTPGLVAAPNSTGDISSRCATARPAVAWIRPGTDAENSVVEAVRAVRATMTPAAATFAAHVLGLPLSTCAPDPTPLSEYDDSIRQPSLCSNP